MVLTARRTSQLAHAGSRWLATALCAYEVSALTSRRVPTPTELSTRHKLLGPALVAALVVHLFRQPRVHVQQIVVADPTQIPRLAS